MTLSAPLAVLRGVTWMLDVLIETGTSSGVFNRASGPARKTWIVRAVRLRRSMFSLNVTETGSRVLDAGIAWPADTGEVAMTCGPRVSTNSLIQACGSRA